MNIAICYRGHLRTISKTYDNHVKNLFAGHNIDIYCHTWKGAYDDDIESFSKYVKLIVSEYPKDFYKHPFNSLFFDNKINTIYDKKLRLTNGVLHSIPYNTISLLYSINKVFSLSQIYSNKYDYICILRPDIVFGDKINWNQIKHDSINISWYINVGEKLSYNPSIIDHIAIGSKELISTYADTFLYIPYYYFNENMPLVSEVLLGKHLSDHRIDINMLSSTHSVLRINNYNDMDNFDK